MRKSIYNILDNGGRPFRVIVYKNNIDIYRNKNEIFGLSKEFITSYKNVDKIFIADGESYGKKCPEYVGCNILVKLPNLDLPFHIRNHHAIPKKSYIHRYLYIGLAIFEFVLEDEIVNFYAEVGNSEVPYPLAVSKNNYYLLWRCMSRDKRDVDSTFTYIPISNAPENIKPVGDYNIWSYVIEHYRIDGRYNELPYNDTMVTIHDRIC